MDLILADLSVMDDPFGQGRVLSDVLIRFGILE